MIKKFTYENLDSGAKLEVRVDLSEENGRWAATLIRDKDAPGPGAPVFYGTTSEQAERQLRKIFDKDHDLISVEVE